MFIPELRVFPLPVANNVRLICNYLSPEKAANKSRPFAEKTYSLYPELVGKLDMVSDEERVSIIKAAVEKHLAENSENIEKRIDYIKNRFDSFIPGFLNSILQLYNCEWPSDRPYIDCYVGYIPFYPRSAENKWFYVSYHDEERVFAGAVHEINHMMMYEKWKEMNGLDELREPSYPSPMWHLMEIVVDPTLNDESVRKYTLYENKAYDQFYTKMIGEKSVMEHIGDMYDRKTCIEDFLTEAYAFVESHIGEIA